MSYYVYSDRSFFDFWARSLNENWFHELRKSQTRVQDESHYYYYRQHMQKSPERVFTMADDKEISAETHMQKSPETVFTMADDKEISAETSKRTCDHMNEDHYVTVHAMAKYLGASGDARLKSITLSGCKIQVVSCKGDVCEVQTVIYPFTPPLTSPSQARSALIAVHDKVCAPRLHWLVSKPLALIICSIIAVMGYGTWMGVPEMTEALGNAKQLNFYVEKIFGSASVLAELVRFFFYFSIAAHVAEAIWAVYKCKSVLKLKSQACLMWFLTISAVGYPIFEELLTLLTIDRVSKQAAAAKKSK
jgi:hypothetical protein